MASLALTGASLWRAMSMRDRPAGCATCASRLCGALCGSGRPPRGGRRRSFVGGERLLVANGRCRRRRGSAPRIRRRAGAGVRRRRRARAAACDHNTTLAATRRHPRGSVSDQHDTRRHTATSARQRARPTRHSPPHGDIDADDICCCGRRPRRAVQLPGARQSMVLKDQRFRARVNPLAPNLRARAREGAALAARARGWCATAPRFKQLR